MKNSEVVSKMHYADQLLQGVPNSVAYLRHLVNGEHTNPFIAEALRTGFEGVYMELAKLELARYGDQVTWTPDNMEQSLHRVHERLDCDDFVIPAFFFILMRYADNEVLPGEIMQRLEDEIIGFKYWIDEPGMDIHLPCYFTENHQILYHTIEYLAGQLYPDRIFPSNGQTGAWHREHAAAYLHRWLTWRRRFGFSEWLSSTYYAVDLLALVTLKELCDREDFRRQAEQLLNLLLLDMAVHSFKGCFCATNGRMYNGPTMFPLCAATNAAMAYLWGDEPARRHMLDYALHADVVVMAVSGFQAPDAIKAIAHDTASPVEAFQRMSLNVEDAEKLGVDPADFDNIMLFWSLHTFHHRKVIENSRKFCPWWYNMDAAIAANLEKFQLMEKAGAITDSDPNGSALTEVNIYTYRTANYMLSCAQDYRRGRTNFQQHIWQASLGGEAVVFATAPGAGDFTSRPNYFVGNSFMPKATAYKNVLISIHRIPADTTYGLCTHAYFPRHAFDEVVEKNGWIFGRKGEGYVGLKSCRRGGSWRPKNPALFQSIFHSEWEKYFYAAREYEFFVAGHTNIWVCELGEPATHGTFAQFVDSVSQSRTEGDTFHFSYDSPSLGHMETGWNEPFTVNGEVVPVRGYKRYDNPYCQAEYDTMRYDIHAGGEKLTIDFEEISS